MAVLPLPVQPRELSLSLERRRSPQESAFTGAVQHVVGAGAIWRGYVDLPPIFTRDTWAECRDIIRRVMSGSDRLAVPIIDGSYLYLFRTAAANQDIFHEILCEIDTRAVINKAGTRLVVYNPKRLLMGGTEDIIWDELAAGHHVTVVWHSGAETVERAAATQHARTLHRDNFVATFSMLSAADRAELDAMELTDPSQLYNPRTDARITADRAELWELSPPVPQMFRADTAGTDGLWSTVQAQFCEPFVPALISNDDALGHTIRDRAVLPNRIEVVSSTLWP